MENYAKLVSTHWKDWEGLTGQDLDALTSGLQAILVKNAAQDVKDKALEILSHKQMTD